MTSATEEKPAAVAPKPATIRLTPKRPCGCRDVREIAQASAEIARQDERATGDVEV
jgi:hypothetical protein